MKMHEREEQKRSYARVLLHVGLGLKEGQHVCVEAPAEAADFVALLTEEALEAGGRGVSVFWHSEGTDQAMLRKGCFLEDEPLGQAQLAAAEALASQGAAYLKLEAPSFLEGAGISGELLQRKKLEDRRLRTLFQEKARGSGQTLACVPCPSWADKVYPHLREEERLPRLWQTVLSCTYSDREDPLAQWQSYLEAVTRRKQELDKRGYEEFHYFGGGTDFTIRPAEGDFWKGGCVRTKERVSVPNIPTQEVFLTPHKYSASGHVAATMPVSWGGSLIEGIELDFSEGRIADCHAKSHEDLLRAVIETDEGSHFLGEMALVDGNNPIAKKEMLFYTTLYDENASCHLAIGNAIGPPVNRGEREKRGMNCSAVHMDFMVGSRELCIEGRRPDGSWEELLRNGELV